MRDQKMNGQTRLADIAADSLMLILQLKSSQDFGEATLLGDRILEMLNDLEQRAKKENFDSEDIQQVKFALVAFIDETIITSNWSEKQNWMANPLQLRLYNRFDLGEEIFKKLEELRRRSRSNSQVLEVYYLCLVLGFKGQYAIVEQDKLRMIINEVYQDLQRYQDKSTMILSPRGKRKEEIKQVIKRDVPFMSFGIGALAIGFLFYIVIVLLSKNTTQHVIELIQSLL
jgi:type VI secretion system protein ImpK